MQFILETSIKGKGYNNYDFLIREIKELDLKVWRLVFILDIINTNDFETGKCLPAQGRYRPGS